MRQNRLIQKTTTAPDTCASARGVIERLTRTRRVEAMVRNICGGPAFDLFDLVQLVYLALLECDARKVLALHERGEIDYFVARIIETQYRSSSSPWYCQCRKFGARTRGIAPESYSNG